LQTNLKKSTLYNGDIINGVPVITQLNLDDLVAGKIYRFMFKGADMNIGQSWYVPVIIAKGVNAGAKLLLNTGIHGDELNGSRVIQQLFATLDPNQLSGTIMGVLQACPNSLMHISKNWYLSTDGGDYVNMNRTFPGKLDGDSAHQHAYLLWNNLWLNNVDYAIDLHSQSTDTIYPLFVFADYRNPICQRMAELIPADQIKNDEGEKGTLETTFIEHNIPAITIELGAARIYQSDYIARSIEGIHNILIEFRITQGECEHNAHKHTSFVGNEMLSIRAKVGGYAEILVQLGDEVSAEQIVARQLNPFGDIICQYTSPIAGKVLSLGTGATREAGGLLVRILFNK
jgi:predicted deacylase